MNWVDAIVVGIVALSALLAFMRGLTRELLAVAAWAGAAYWADATAPLIEPRVQEYLTNKDYAQIAAVGIMFVVGLVFLSVVAAMIGGVVRNSLLGGLDRTLGIVFGVARGAAVIVLAYIVGGIIVEPERWPAPVLEARTLPFAYGGAVWVAGLVPEEYRPRVIPPPAGRGTRAADLLHANPQGRALARP